MNADMMGRKDVDGEDVVQVETLDEEPLEHGRPEHGNHQLFYGDSSKKLNTFLLIRKEKSIFHVKQSSFLVLRLNKRCK